MGLKEACSSQAEGKDFYTRPPAVSVVRPAADCGVSLGQGKTDGAERTFISFSKKCFCLHFSGLKTC